MQVRDIEEVRIADIVHDVVGQLIVTWEDKPRTKECGNEPRVTDNGDPSRANEYAGVAKRYGLHELLRLVGGLHAARRNVCRPGTAIPVAKFVSL